MIRGISMHEFYRRQVKLIGIDAQVKLQKAKVLIVGAGGLGHPVANYLAAAGVGHITIADFDQVEVSNLHRQTLFKLSDCGKNKAQALVSHLCEQNPLINIQAYPHAFNNFTKENLVTNVDLVIDATDNFTSKFLIHESCHRQKTPLLQASISSWQGKIHFFDFKKDSPCLECLYTTPPSEGCVSNCADSGVMGSTAGVFGTILSSEALKFLTSQIVLDPGTSFLMNLETLDIQKLKFKKNDNCRLCSGDLVELKNELEVMTSFEVESACLIDLRMTPDFIPKADQNYILYCHKGVASLKKVQELRYQGYHQVWSLKGGAASL
jgi:molybdopterin/thiamine biosynthesis adenylyltransferase